MMNYTTHDDASIHTRKPAIASCGEHHAFNCGMLEGLLKYHLVYSGAPGITVTDRAQFGRWVNENIERCRSEARQLYPIS